MECPKEESTNPEKTVPKNSNKIKENSTTSTTEPESKESIENSSNKIEEIDNPQTSSPEQSQNEQSTTIANETSSSDDSDEKKSEQEVLYIQDVGFTVKIICPGTQSFDIQVCKSMFSFPSEISFEVNIYFFI